MSLLKRKLSVHGKLLNDDLFHPLIVCYKSFEMYQLKIQWGMSESTDNDCYPCIMAKYVNFDVSIQS